MLGCIQDSHSSLACIASAIGFICLYLMLHTSHTDRYDILITLLYTSKMGEMQVEYMCCNCFRELGNQGFILSCGEFVCNGCIDYIKIHKLCPSCMKSVNFISLEDSENIPEEVKDSIIDIADVMENMYKTMKFQNDYSKKMIKQILKMNSKQQSEITEFRRVITNLENQLNFSDNNTNTNRAIVGVESSKSPIFLKDADFNSSESPFKRQRGESFDISSRNQHHNVSPTPTAAAPNTLPSSNEERVSLKFGNTMLPPPIRSSKILNGSAKTEQIQERPISARSDTSSNINKLIGDPQYKVTEPIRRSDQSLSSNLQYQYQSQDLGNRQRPYTTGTQSVPDRVRSPIIRTSNISSRAPTSIYSDANRSVPLYTPNKNWSRPSS